VLRKSFIKRGFLDEGPSFLFKPVSPTVLFKKGEAGAGYTRI
jgi:hypothetical protein